MDLIRIKNVEKKYKNGVTALYDITLDIEKGEFKNAINYIIEYASMGNKYYDERQPWIQVKENIELILKDAMR